MSDNGQKPFWKSRKFGYTVVNMVQMITSGVLCVSFPDHAQWIAAVGGSLCIILLVTVWGHTYTDAKAIASGNVVNNNPPGGGATNVTQPAPPRNRR